MPLEDHDSHSHSSRTHYTTRRIFPLVSTTWSQQHPSPLLRFVTRPSHAAAFTVVVHLVSTQSGRLVRHPSVFPLVLRGYMSFRSLDPFPPTTPPLCTAPTHCSTSRQRTRRRLRPQHSTPAMYVCIPTAASANHTHPTLTHRSPMSWSGAWYGFTSPGTARRFCSCCCSCCALCSCVSSW